MEQPALGSYLDVSSEEVSEISAGRSGDGDAHGTLEVMGSNERWSFVTTHTLVAADVPALAVPGQSGMGRTWCPPRGAPYCYNSQSACLRAVRVRYLANFFGVPSLWGRDNPPFQRILNLPDKSVFLRNLNREVTGAPEEKRKGFTE